MFIFGQSPDTKKDYKCGLGSVNNLVPSLNDKVLKLWGNITEKMDKMGYINGLTYQALPYDFRLGMH